MIDIICSHKEHINMAAFLVYMVVEFYIGKTDRTKSNSVLEFILNMVTKIGRYKKQGDK